MDDRTTGFASPLHGEEDAPALGRVSVSAEPIPTTVARWFHEAIDGRRAEVQLALGVSKTTLQRYADSSLHLPLHAVMVAPPYVSQIVLRRALDHAMATPWRGEETEVRMAAKACREAGALAYQLHACPPGALSAGAREEFAEKAETIAAWLWALAQRLRRGGR